MTLRREVEIAGMVRPASFSTLWKSASRSGLRSATRTQVSVGSTSVKPSRATRFRCLAHSSGEASWMGPPWESTLPNGSMAAAIGQFSAV